MGVFSPKYSILGRTVSNKMIFRQFSDIANVGGALFAPACMSYMHGIYRVGCLWCVQWYFYIPVTTN